MDSPFSVCEHVLSVVRAELKRAKREPACSLVAAGGITIDSCDGGYLIVAPERVYRARTPFPTEATDDQSAWEAELIGVDVVVRIERCVPVLTDAGQAPPIDEQSAAYQGVLEDAAVVWKACVGELITADGWLRANVTQLFVGPLGGCGGSETRMSLGIGMEEWCIEYPETDEGET